MVAGLLYLIGLITVLVTVAMGGYQAPEAIAQFNDALGEGGSDVLETVARLGRSFAWAFYPLVGGLALMGFARVIMLLGAINRALRSQV